MQEDLILYRVLAVLMEDRERGRRRTLEEYQEMFPGHEALVARHWDGITQETAGESLTMALPRGDVMEPSEHLGPYAIAGELGRGGQGVVYRATDTRTGLPVALKVLRFHGLESRATLARFRREATVSTEVDHPALCPVLEHGIIDGMPFIAMPLLEGSTLNHLGARSGAATRSEFPATSEGAEGLLDSSWPVRCDENRIARIARLFIQIAEGLQAAHERGFVHRDIKPGNIFVESGLANGTDAAERAILLDFGLAAALTSDDGTLTLTGDLLGTPIYMSPEQLTRQTVRVDHRTDIYSLGVALYECLAGRPPHVEATRERLYQAILAKEPPSIRTLNPAVSKGLAAVITTALEKDRDRRYDTAGALAEDLRCCLARRPVRARPPGPVGRTLRWIRRNRAAATAVGFAFLLFVAGPISFLVYQSGVLGELELQQERTHDEKVRADREAEHAKLAAGEERQSATWAREAIDTMLTRVSSSVLDVIPKTAALRRELLEDALRFYRRLLNRRASNVDVIEGIARTWLEVAKLELRLGRLKKATEASGMAVHQLSELLSTGRPVHLILAHAHNERYAELFAARRIDDAREEMERALTLVRLHPESERAYPTGVSSILSNAAHLSVARGRFLEAESVAMESLRVLQQHGNQHEVDTLRALGAAFQTLGLVQTRLCRYEDAGATCTRAADVFSKALEIRRDDPLSMSQRAISLNYAGIALWNARRHEDARKAFAESIRTSERLLEQFPDAEGERADLGRALVHWAKTHLPEGIVEAEAHLQRARAVVKKLEDMHSQVDVGTLRAQVLEVTARLCELRGDQTNALKTIDASVEAIERAVKEMPTDPQVWSQALATRAVRARMLMNQGRLDESAVDALEAAVAEADRFGGSVNTGAEGPIEAAIILASVATLVRYRLGAGSRFTESQAREWLGNAFTFLEKAVSAGYRDADTLRQHPALMLLRSSPRFERILKSMES